MNWKIVVIVLLVIAAVMVNKGDISKAWINKAGTNQTKPYHELTPKEQLVIHDACREKYWRVEGQLKWRLEQSYLYRRWEMVSEYQKALQQMESVRPLIGDVRCDPAPIQADLQRMEDHLNNRR